MNVRKFSFGKIKLLQSGLAEVIVDEGVDINTEMVDEIHQVFLSIFPGAFSLLINKSNSYSTQLDALIKFGTLKAINKIAVFAPNQMAKLSADFAANIPSSAVLDIQVFTDRDDALAWLNDIAKAI
ncbi:STAS/SEC14 domain-containing protein [Thalassomonas viridans]|uniref:STAS/SEC14 domain-containing protein n=1 Tax=Thalassomonas viridans TaxID=137584 RepID=A0AAF0CAQ9_9GAMM|nr:STAS/SEC14 domain-containing protein [Thalassomonas viridans]WDE08847.1 STAS/SEC14 domain-containing protein [Thalassomonas viridans]